ncbi:MAG: aromatic amino acid lyase [Candidatus Eisenbacteria bacterium]|uniref:Aromatic amino acid lyase n=1 Tax=Eiseniibacteriota bacterium TaxID=2212470 RepID=A0A538U640_UNCEI|nr:MAG: aromatic amino acid lyase [Candidatus Eisenbacteria bacterium]
MIELGARPLLVSDVVAVARGRAPVRLARDARRRMTESRAIIDDAVQAERPVYGVNTGFGELKGTRIPIDQVRQLQLNLLRSHAPPRSSTAARACGPRSWMHCWHCSSAASRRSFLSRARSERRAISRRWPISLWCWSAKATPGSAEPTKATRAACRLRSRCEAPVSSRWRSRPRKGWR